MGNTFGQLISECISGLIDAKIEDTYSSKSREYEKELCELIDNMFSALKV